MLACLCLLAGVTKDTQACMHGQHVSGCCVLGLATEVTAWQLLLLLLTACSASAAAVGAVTHTACLPVLAGQVEVLQHSDQRPYCLGHEVHHLLTLLLHLDAVLERQDVGVAQLQSDTPRT